MNRIVALLTGFVPLAVFAQAATGDVPPPVPAAKHPEGVGMGVIVGGWEYIWACYIITVVVLSSYAAYLWLRRPAVSSKDFP
jgi:hypothetical protein